MLRQIEWSEQNGSITKNGVLPVTTLFFSEFCFSLRTSYEELIWCTNDTNTHIRTFCKPWSYVWRCFFPVSILKRQIWTDFTYCCGKVFLYYFTPTQLTFTSSKSTIETVEKGVKYVQICHWRHSGVFIVNFKHISPLFLMFLLLTLNK